MKENNNSKNNNYKNNNSNNKSKNNCNKSKLNLIIIIIISRVIKRGINKFYSVITWIILMKGQ